jgi:hypothetical protein
MAKIENSIFDNLKNEMEEEDDALSSEGEQIESHVFIKVMKQAFKEFVTFLDERAIKGSNLANKLRKNRLPSFL